VVLATLTIQVLVSLGNIFEAGSDFGQIGPAVSAASPLGEAAAQSSAPAKKYIKIDLLHTSFTNLT